MRSIPYSHYSRTPLTEAYAAEYEALREQYASEMEQWEADWMEFLQNKYTGKPKIGLILGSGLGVLADEIKNPIKIPKKFKITSSMSAIL